MRISLAHDPDTSDETIVCVWRGGESDTHKMCEIPELYINN